MTCLTASWRQTGSRNIRDTYTERDNTFSDYITIDTHYSATCWYRHIMHMHIVHITKQIAAVPVLTVQQGPGGGEVYTVLIRFF